MRGAPLECAPLHLEGETCTCKSHQRQSQTQRVDSPQLGHFSGGNGSVIPERAKRIGCPHREHAIDICAIAKGIAPTNRRTKAMGTETVDAKPATSKRAKAAKTTARKRFIGLMLTTFGSRRFRCEVIQSRHSPGQPNLGQSSSVYWQRKHPLRRERQHPTQAKRQESSGSPHRHFSYR